MRIRSMSSNVGSGIVVEVDVEVVDVEVDEVVVGVVVVEVEEVEWEVPDVAGAAVVEDTVSEKVSETGDAAVAAGSAAAITARSGSGTIPRLSIDSRTAPDVRVARIDTTAIDRKAGVSPVRRYRPGDTEGGRGRHVSVDRLCRPR
jgi:hypothetical protein